MPPEMMQGAPPGMPMDLTAPPPPQQMMPEEIDPALLMQLMGSGAPQF